MVANAAKILPKVSKTSQNYHRKETFSYPLRIDSKRPARRWLVYVGKMKFCMMSSPICVYRKASCFAKVRGRLRWVSVAHTLCGICRATYLLVYLFFQIQYIDGEANELLKFPFIPSMIQRTLNSQRQNCFLGPCVLYILEFLGSMSDDGEQ